jgi:hypothetical protein
MDRGTTTTTTIVASIVIIIVVLSSGTANLGIAPHNVVLCTFSTADVFSNADLDALVRERH